MWKIITYKSWIRKSVESPLSLYIKYIILYFYLNSVKALYNFLFKILFDKKIMKSLLLIENLRLESYRLILCQISFTSISIKLIPHFFFHYHSLVLWLSLPLFQKTFRQHIWEDLLSYYWESPLCGRRQNIWSDFIRIDKYKFLPPSSFFLPLSFTHYMTL